MRKRLVPRQRASEDTRGSQWLDLRMTTAEITSEDPDHPIECALLYDDGHGWYAGEPGQQTLRIRFDHPQNVQRICLLFQETSIARTHEFHLRWSPDDGRSVHEIVRQQWNFSPDGATSESEDYAVDLRGVTTLELTITPDIRDSEQAYASLRRLRLA